MDPVLKLLSNLPPSLKHMSLGHPKYCCPHTMSEKQKQNIKQAESKRLVNKLCALLPEFYNHDGAKEEKMKLNLESIHLSNINLSKDERQYLIFMFGYNNRFHFDKPPSRMSRCYQGIYYLTFIE